MSGTWIDEEPGPKELRQELQRVRRRFRARWKLIVLLTLLATALVVMYEARKDKTYASTLSLRVTEGDFDALTSPPTTGELEDHILKVALSRARLFEVMEEHSLYPSLRALDENLALETMRDNITVDVVRNYFGQKRFAGDPPRSARIALTYAGNDPNKSHQVVQHLGQLVSELEAKTREHAAKAAAAATEQRVTVVRDHLDQLRAEQAAFELVAMEQAPPEAAMLHVKVRGLQKSIQYLEHQLMTALRDNSGFDLRSAIEDGHLGLRFEIVDPGRPARVMLSRQAELVVLAVVVLLLMFPVMAVAVGVFDLKVYDSDDVKRLGVVPLGHVPAFEGDSVGSFRQRFVIERSVT